MPFSWANQLVKTEKKLLQRTIILAKINPDFRKDHPELAREAELGNTQVEVKKFVKKKLDKHIKYGNVPKPSVIIKRMNRVV